MNRIKTSARAAPIALVMYILLGTCSIPEPLPELPWFGTFLGGAAVDDCDAVTTDREGYVYLACHVVSVDLPGIGNRQLNPEDPMNAYVVKLTPQLDAAKWGVLLAGSGYDGAFAIAVDERGQVFVTGLTASPDFPTTANALQKSYGGGEADAFFAEITPNGNLHQVSFLGGSETDRAFALELQTDGTLWIGGSTWSSDFPGVVETAGVKAVDANAFLARLTLQPTPAVTSVVLGGGRYEKVTGIATDGHGNVFAAGLTKSADFLTRNAFQTELLGTGDGFVAKLSGNDLRLEYSTFIGGSDDDAIWGIDLLADGTPVVAGTTKSSDLPTTPDAWQRNLAGGQDAFIASLETSGSGLQYCTYLGGSGEDSAAYDGQAIGVDADNRVWMVGQTHSADFPTAGAPQANLGGGDGDGFVAMLDLKSGLRLASYVGGEGRDIAEGLAISPVRIWITGLTSSKQLPFPLVFQPTHGGGRFDSFLVAIAIPP